MILKISQKGTSISYKLLICTVLVAFISSIFPIQIYAKSALSYMPPPTKIIGQSSYFNLPVLKGIKLYPEDTHTPKTNL